MTIIDLAEQSLDLPQLLALAHAGPVVVLTTDGREYVLAEADDFEQEVAQLRNSATFQAFLAERSASRKPRTPIEQVLHSIEAELAEEEARTK